MVGDYGREHLRNVLGPKFNTCQRFRSRTSGCFRVSHFSFHGRRMAPSERRECPSKGYDLGGPDHRIYGEETRELERDKGITRHKYDTRQSLRETDLVRPRRHDFYSL